MKYLVFADDVEQTSSGAGAHAFISAHSDSFEALAEMILHTSWAHIAEFDGSELTIVAERNGADLKLYPKRMAHQRAATATEEA